LFWFALSGAVDVERHARDFMEAAKKLQSYFISLQREERPTTEDMLRKVWSTASL
jgi:mediator of RNA polymerase II transcription subunit 28